MESMEKRHQASYQALKIIDKFCIKHDINYFLMTGTALGAVRHKGFIPWDDDIDVGMTHENYLKFLELFNSNSKEELTEDFFWSHPDTNELHPRFFGQLLHKGQKSLDVIPIVKTSNNLLLRRLQWIQLRVLYVAYLYKIGEKPSIQYKATVSGFCKMILVYLIYPLSWLITRNKILRDAYRVLGRFERLDTDYSMNICDRYPMHTALIKKEWLKKFKFVQFEDGYFPIFDNTDAYLTHLYGDYMKLPPERERKPPHDDYLIRVKYKTR